MHSDQIIILDWRRQLHLEAVERYHFQFVNYEHDFEVGQVSAFGQFWCDRRVVVQRFNRSNLQLVLLNANQHVDCVVNFDARRVNALEFFFADLAKMALNRVEAIRDEIVGVFPARSAAVIFWQRGGLVLWDCGILVLVYVGAEGLLVLGAKWVEIGFGLEIFDYSLFDVRKGEKFFYTHLGGVNRSNLEVAAIF